MRLRVRATVYDLPTKGKGPRVTTFPTANGRYVVRYQEVEFDYSISGGEKLDPNTDKPTIRTCWLGLFRVPFKLRGEGLGRKVLDQFCDQLKAAGISYIHLYPKSMGRGSNDENLERFYLSCGFKPGSLGEMEKYL